MNTLVNRLFKPLVISGTVIAALVTTANPAYAVPECPTIAAVSAAVGSTATDSNFRSCEFKVGEDTISFQIDASSNIDADLAARLAAGALHYGFTTACAGVLRLQLNLDAGATDFVAEPFNERGTRASERGDASNAIGTLDDPHAVAACCRHPGGFETGDSSADH